MNSTIEALVDIEAPSDVEISPDGAHVAFVLGHSYKPDKDTAHPKTIQVIDVASKRVRAFTAKGTGTNSQPHWSPDSRQLVFVSNRASKSESQLYVIDLDGGEAQALTDLRGKVDLPKWSADGHSIAFLYCPNSDTDPVVVDAVPPFNRVWILNLETGALNAITPETVHVFEYDWSEDGKTLAVLISPHPNPQEGWYSAQLHTVDVESGAFHQVFEAHHQLGRLSFSPDGQSIAFVSGVMSDEGNVAGEVYTVPTAGGEPRNLTPDSAYSVTWIEWRAEGILYGARQVDEAVAALIDPESGEQRGIAQGAFTINGWGMQRMHPAQNGTFAALRESFTEIPNVYLGAIKDGSWKAMTDLPIARDTFPPLRVENKFWQGGAGDRVHGYLVYPPNYDPSRRYPLFLHVHGGPSWGYVPRYISPWDRLISALGCLVLMPNPRGSWGYGHQYQSANVGDLGGGDWQDINAGVDTVIHEGLADADQMAVGGWSYGGYLTTWIVTQTDRFRCAIAGAAITNYESNYGVVPNREWQTTLFGSHVYDDYDLHRSRSPIAFASRVKTPTLLLHGERDEAVPAAQSLEFYTALKHFGVPTELVLYPREPHHAQERAHQIDTYERIVGWISRYLLL
ncbi:MAG TPA: S9 family peptidase [Phototrophicaceae bacterium]|nr:S9 family peptidase [Phototrophicaceae bacterium]